MSVVILKYEDLCNGKDFYNEIEEAYGKNGLGILLVSGVPKVSEYRKKLLPLAYQFSQFDEKIKSKYEHKESSYSFGWSHGKEKFKGKYDISKGSYYNNPQYDKITDDKELIKKYPFCCNPNIWPKDDLPELENAFKNMGQLIVDVGLLVAKQCDSYIKKKNDKYEEKIYDIIKESPICKARLLFYYPKKENEESTENSDDWCGWHLDHGSLTGLTCGMYLNEKGEEIKTNDKRPGLYIKNRKGEMIKAVYNEDYLAFQIGETAQIHTGGDLAATPHCVRGTFEKGVGRAQFAVFMEPKWDYKMNYPKNKTISDCEVNCLKDDMVFSDFTEERLKEYY